MDRQLGLVGRKAREEAGKASRIQKTQIFVGHIKEYGLDPESKDFYVLQRSSWLYWREARLEAKRKEVGKLRHTGIDRKQCPELQQ